MKIIKTYHDLAMNPVRTKTGPGCSAQRLAKALLQGGRSDKT